MAKLGPELKFLACHYGQRENLRFGKGIYFILCREDREKKKEGEIQENKRKVM